MMTVAPIANNAANYYTHEDNYYFLGNLEARWMGEGAKSLGLEGEVTKDQLGEILEGRLPNGQSLERRENGKNVHREGQDLTFSAPKSVSVLGLVLGDKRMIDAHNHAVEVALKEVESLASTRVMVEGKTSLEMTKNLVIVAFNHDTSREHDPLVHTHALVMNMTKHNGEWRTLSSDTQQKSGFSEAVYALQVSLGQIYRHALRERVESFGMQTHETGKNGLWEIVGVPVVPFSQRHAQIMDAVGHEASLKSRDVAALDTRQAKTTPEKSELLTDWFDRLDKNGFGPEERKKFYADAEQRMAKGDTGSMPREILPDITRAVTDAIALLSDKQLSMNYSQVLAKSLGGLEARAGMIAQVREAIDVAIEQRQLIPLDEKKGLFTSSIHLMDELKLQQIATDMKQHNRTISFQARTETLAPVMEKVADTLPSIAIVASQGLGKAQRDGVLDGVTMAQSQGRDVAVMTLDTTSRQAFANDKRFAYVPKMTLSDSQPLKPNSTLLVANAEKLSLKSALSLLESAQSANVQVLMMDSGGRKGTGNVLATLQDAGVPRFQGEASAVLTVKTAHIPDKNHRYAALAADYAQLHSDMKPVVAQVSGVREQKIVTDTIRQTLTEHGMLSEKTVTVTQLKPVWLDSHSRKQIDSYREGMVMERWNADKKEVERYTIDRVTPETRSVTLLDDQGQKQVMKPQQFDGQWSAYQRQTMDIKQGERLTILAKQNKLSARDAVTVSGFMPNAIMINFNGKTHRIDVREGVKADYGYVTAPGQQANDTGTVLLAASARDTQPTLLNTAARSGEHITVYTPLDKMETERRLSRSPVYQQARQLVGVEGQDAKAIEQAADNAAHALWSKPEKALQQGMGLAQESQVFFSRIDAIAKALPLHASLDSQSVGNAFDRLVSQKAIIPVSSGKGAAQQHYVAASTWEMEKQILTTILAGKGTQTPLMASVPEAQLDGLTSGQKAATELILGSRDQFVGIQGYAGVGKTTQFTAVLKALDTLPAAQRPEVIGLAPTHRAVGEMADVGVKSQTLHAFLMDANQRQQQGETLDFKNTLFLVDESSMVGNRNLSEVLQIIAHGGGRGVLSGDTAQLLSVDSGTPFALAQERSVLDTAIMKEIVRQRPELRPTIEAIIAGNIQTAIDTMNRVTPDVVSRRAGAELPEQSVINSGDKVITHILDDYRGRTAEAQKETLIVVQTNRDKDELNRGIHQILVEQGQLQGGRNVPILVRESTRTEALLSTVGMAAHVGKIALIQEQYYRIAVTETGVSEGVVTLVDEEGKGHLLSAFESSLRDIGIYRQESRHIAVGEKISFTRTDKERGRVMNSDWTVSEVSENGKITITKGDESRELDPNRALTDQHVDYGYAGTAHKAQGTSSQFVIVLGGVAGDRRSLATLRDAYVALSRTKAHVQTYSDDLDKWTKAIENPGNRQTAHDVLLAEQDRAAKVGNQLFDHAKPLNETAIGRALSRQMGLGDTHEGKFVYPSTKYPEPHVAWPAYDVHGKAQGTMLQAIELDGDKLQGLRAEGRLLGSEQAQFIVVKPSQNGKTVIVNSLDSAFGAMAQQPEQGVVVQLYPDERLHTAMIEKITQGEVDNAYANPNATQTDKANSDPKSLQTPEEQAMDKALKEAEAALRQQTSSESKTPELNEEELKLVMAQERDSLLKGEHDFMEAKERVIEKAVQFERQHQQQQREALRQQEREIVMEKSRDREFGD
ncbi:MULTISPECIES: conjugative transfer relaxase/helicase TraI [Providencia]|uniref:conjugative transfer relaxase/helicase TraI n=2 Tax=Enterobacterales TaxID=91347 RepID=UPI0003E1D937|nr:MULTISPECIES: conjugative transfer relaxase/helicase TraI [Providencia]ETS99316.1 conjugative transfer relaxase protein TraI [Providencia alcalifaciens PAL-3]EUC99118.1 conjugative transfer relaxase protein TraI [Providencia alcalifaciens PAL-1]MTC48173.1 conjugative transfer relaxase/helicase TraI [Providencia alcalifaciens]